MDIQVDKGQITGIRKLAVHNEYAIIYTEKEDVKALQQAWEWYEILMMTCRNFKDQKGIDFDVRSLWQAKNWLNQVAVNNIPSSINEPLVLVGEQLLDVLEYHVKLGQ